MPSIPTILAAAGVGAIALQNASVPLARDPFFNFLRLDLEPRERQLSDTEPLDLTVSDPGERPPLRRYGAEDGSVEGLPPAINDEGAPDAPPTVARQDDETLRNEAFDLVKKFLVLCAGGTTLAVAAHDFGAGRHSPLAPMAEQALDRTVTL